MKIEDLDEKDYKNLIMICVKFKIKNMWMGSIAKAQLMHALGGTWGTDRFEDVLRHASKSQLEEGLKICAPYLKSLFSLFFIIKQEGDLK